MANFKKLAKGYEKVGIAALEKFIRIPSVYDEKSIAPGQPYGKDVKNALDYFAKLGKDYGFSVDKCNGYCTELSIGEEGPLIGIYGHSDVVPIGGSWKYQPFGGALDNGVVYGRGACDDKGPLLAAFFATKLLKDNGLLKGFRVKIVSGGDEERGSSCLRYYFEEHKGEAPKFGFTPDADWPLIYAEKGMTGGTLTLDLDLDPVIAMNGGAVSNAVCDSLLVTLKPDQKFEKHLKDTGVKCDISSSKELLTVRFIGKTSHGSLPEKGINAAKIAFETIGKFYGIEALKKVASVMDNDGKSWGGYEASPELGGTTYNFGVINYDGKTLSMSLDFRYGESVDPDKKLETLKAALGGASFNQRSRAKHLLYDKKSPLVSTLMSAYKKETLRFFDKPLAIGGGTYAKEAPNTVAFGAEWPKHPGNMHSPDEYIYVSDFVKDIAIYARAIYMLGTKK